MRKHHSQDKDLQRYVRRSNKVMLVFVVSLFISGGFELVKAVTEPCPEKCICLSQTKVLCNGAGLSHIPTDLPVEVEELSFSRNELGTLEKEMFSPWGNIRTLFLDANKIRILHPFIFKGLPHLKELSIKNNPLSQLTQFSFSGLENISQVDLRNNKIQTIHPYAFAGSRNIAMLFLQGNPVIRVRSRAFSGLRMVQFLYLPSWIKVIEADSFYDLQGIGLLRLHSLSLHALRPYTFRGLQNVTQISIQESDLGILRNLAFNGFNNIGELRMINNKVDMLESLSVLESANVDGVVVKGNHFLNIDSERDILDIQANERTIIVENYFPCNCKLHWVLSSPSARAAPLFALHNYCVSPYGLHGKSIEVVNVSALGPCLSPQEFQGLSGTPRKVVGSAPLTVIRPCLMVLIFVTFLMVQQFLVFHW